MVLGGWVVGGNELSESNELVGDDLDTDETTDKEEVLAFTRDTEQEGHRVEDVAEDEFQSEIVLSVQVDVTAPPGEKTVDHVQKRNDTQEGGDDHTGDLETEPCAVGESVKSVGGLVLIVIGDDNASSSEGLLLLGVPELAESEGSRDTHDAGRDQSLGVQSHRYIRHQHTTSDGSETRAHDLMQLGHGKMGHKRPDQHGRFSLTDEGRRGSDNGLSARDAHSPEEEDSEFANEPLEDTPVVQELDEGHEEDDGRNDASEEPTQLGNTRVRQENDTVVGEPKEQASKLRDKVEDVISGLGAQDEESNDELEQHTDDDSVPHNLAAVAGSGPETEDEDCQTKQRNSTVGAGVVLALLAYE